MAEPTVISGPAIVGIGGVYIYCEGNIQERLVRQVWSPKMNLVGEFDNRLRSQLITLAFTPAGVMTDAQKAVLFPYNPTHVGTNLLSSETDIVIWTKAGVKITYGAGAVTKCPQIRMGSGQTWLGPMEITCKAEAAKDYDDADAWNAVSAAALSDVSFDETKVKSGAVLATWGAVFANAGTIDGALVDVELAVQNLQPDGYNIVAVMLAGIKYRARFKPYGWTEANFYSYLRLQDSTAILPGESLAKEANTLSLVSATAGLTVALLQMGPGDGEQNYDLNNFRGGEVVFHHKTKWTTGVVQNPLTITIA